MAECVLDASALLALVLAEPGAEFVRRRRRGAVLSAVNQAEVLARLVRRGKDLEESRERLRRLELGVIPFDDEQAALSASLVTAGKALGLSLGDRACLALGLTLGLPVLTAERAWAKLDASLRVELIR